MRVVSTCLVMALLLVACSKPSETTPSEERRIDSHRRMDLGKTLDRAMVEFVKPLSGLNSKEHYAIEFEVLGDQAEVILHSHFNGFQARDGIQIRWRLENGHIHLAIASPGTAFQEVDGVEFTLSDDRRLAVRLDVHDGGPMGGRVLVWPALWAPYGELPRSRSRFVAKNALFDSSSSGVMFLTSARGVFWGVELRGARLVHAVREPAYVR